MDYVMSSIKKMRLYPLAIFLACCLFVALTRAEEIEKKELLSQNNHQEAKTRPSLRGISALGAPGYDQFSFLVERGGVPIQVLMKLNKTTLTMETSLQYNRYLHREETSSLAEFRYYKSCITVGLSAPSYIVSDERISLVLSDTFDSSLAYTFKLDKIEISQQEKIDLMFNAMNKEIMDLKEKLWFLETSTNKIAKGRYIRSRDPKMIDYIEGRAPNYTGTYGDQYTLQSVLYLYSGEFYYCNEDTRCPSQRQPNELSIRPLTIEFPRSIPVKKISFELANGGGCPYSNTIDFHVKPRYISSSNTALDKKYSQYGTTYHYKQLDEARYTINKKKVSDGFVEYQLEGSDYSLVDGIVLSISTKGFASPSGIQFDGRCDYVLRNLIVT